MKLFLVSVVRVLLTFLLKYCTRIRIRNCRYGSRSGQMIRIRRDPAPQHWYRQYTTNIRQYRHQTLQTVQSTLVDITEGRQFRRQKLHTKTVQMVRLYRQFTVQMVDIQTIHSTDGRGYKRLTVQIVLQTVQTVDSIDSRLCTQQTEQRQTVQIRAVYR